MFASLLVIVLVAIRSVETIYLTNRQVNLIVMRVVCFFYFMHYNICLEYSCESLKNAGNLSDYDQKNSRE